MVTPFMFKPGTKNTVYAGYGNLYSASPGNDITTQLSNFGNIPGASISSSSSSSHFNVSQFDPETICFWRACSQDPGDVGRVSWSLARKHRAGCWKEPIFFGALRRRTRKYASFLMTSRALHPNLFEQPVKNYRIGTIGCFWHRRTVWVIRVSHHLYSGIRRSNCAVAPACGTLLAVVIFCKMFWGKNAFTCGSGCPGHDRAGGSGRQGFQAHCYGNLRAWFCCRPFPGKFHINSGIEQESGRAYKKH